MHSKAYRTVGISITLLGLTALTALAAPPNLDWPQWRGPDRTGMSQETGLLKMWPAGGPHLAWKATGFGEGHAAPAVYQGKIYGQGLQGQEKEVVWAANASDGKLLWTTQIDGMNRLQGGQGGYGPRSTPTISGNRLYVEGVGGTVACLEMGSGALVWKKNLRSDFGGHLPTWGFSESPLVDGNRVIVTPGGPQATLVALNKADGAVLWQSAVPNGGDAGYSSAIVETVDGIRQYIQFTHGGVVGVAAETGKPLWYDPFAQNNTANASTPLYSDHQVFVGAGYGKGGCLIKLTTQGGNVTASEVYRTPNMKNHHGGMVLVNGYIYGFDEQQLTCLDFKTGEVKWFNRSVGKGSVTYADGNLICRSERGPVALVQATPNGYMELGRFDQPDRSPANSWPYPVVANGHLYLRDMDELLCYDLK